MGIKNRLERLEKRSGVADGICPVCHFGPDDIRTLVFVSHLESDTHGEFMRRSAPGEQGPDQPERPRCPRCGGFMSIAIVDDFDPADQPDKADE
jgi:hypothetical protein